MSLSKSKKSAPSSQRNISSDLLKILSLIVVCFVSFTACNSFDPMKDVDFVYNLNELEEQGFFEKQAEKAVKREPLEVTLDMSIKENREYEFADQLSNIIKECEDCVAATYFQNKECKGQDVGKVDKRTLIYTLKHKESIRYDTLSYCAGILSQDNLKVANKDQTSSSNIRDISGVQHELDTDKGKYYFTVNLLKDGSYLGLTILNKKGEVLDTVADEWTKKGIHQLAWDFKKFEKGSYKCLVVIDRQRWMEEVQIK